MTDHVPKSRTAQVKASAGVRIARIAYAAIAVLTAAVIFLGSFI